MNIIKKITFLSIIHFLFIVPTKAQLNLSNPIPADYFSNPLNIKLFLAGSFGEIRTNHFHSGIDIKTNQIEGLPVYAVADGYISRLRVQIGGFGNAIYINHPNGMTSVYGHLQKFNPLVAQRIKDLQYKDQSFTEDFILTPIEIPVKKGDLIAWSGNTGGSAGPHLHFELRETKTEETINPLTLGIQIPDHIKPVITGFYLYKTNHQPFSENTPKQYFQTIGANGKYQLSKVYFINTNNEIGLGIMAYDSFDGSANKNGLFSTTIKLDDEVIYETIIDHFAFENSRAVNAYIDYPSKLQSGRVIQKGFAAPNAKVNFFKTLKNNGLINLKDDAIHTVTYILKDYSGNKTVLSVKLKNNANLPISSTIPLKGVLFKYTQDNHFENDEVKINIPKYLLYDDLDFKYATLPKTKYSNSKIYAIHNKLTPLHSAYELAIKLDSGLKAYQNKTIIMSTEGGSHGGTFKDGYIKTSPNTFGNFYLKIDTIAPNIVPLNIKEGINLAQQKQILFKISDTLAGIDTFKAFIDEQWVLMEYDYRSGKLWHTFDEKTGFGKHTFKLIVTDRKQNEKTYSINFYR